MPFTQDTVLGRRVRLEDWASFHRDRLLHVLYTLRDSSNDDPTLTNEQIEGVTGLSWENVNELTRWMSSEKPKLLQIARDYVVVNGKASPAWTITPRGVRWVEESPRPR